MTTSDPTTTNSTATTVNGVVKDAGSAIETVVETLIIADVPLLGAPVVKPFFQLLLNWVTGYFEKAAQGGATFAVIDLQVDSEESGISAALAAVIAAEKSGNAQAIQSAIQAYANAQSALVHDDGSAPAS